MSRASDYRAEKAASPITERQALAIRVLHGRLDRTCPELAHLTHAEAGDLIISLRDELAGQVQS